MVEPEKIVCPLCNSPQFIHIATRFDKLNIVRCKQCKLAYVNPRPAAGDIAKMYEGDYYVGEENTKTGYCNYSPSVVSIKCCPPYGWELLLEETALADKRTLDVGCAFGRWVYWSKKEGAKATGIDLAQEGIKWGRDKLGLDLRRTSLYLLDEPRETFEVITMIDLIEHITELDKFMVSLVSFLKPGGLVFVQTPNFESYKTWGERSIHLRFSLEHVLYFEVSSLNNLFAKYGMSPTRETQVLYSIPSDSESYLNMRKARHKGFRTLFARLPGFDLVHLIRFKLCKFKHVYRHDQSRHEGATIIGCYSKQMG